MNGTGQAVRSGLTGWVTGAEAAPSYQTRYGAILEVAKLHFA